MVKCCGNVKTQVDGCQIGRKSPYTPNENKRLKTKKQKDIERDFAKGGESWHFLLPGSGWY
jgi:hypothetical protein